MTKIVLVRNGVVENYFFATDEEKDEKITIAENAGFTVVQNEEALIGWLYENGAFKEPEEKKEPKVKLPNRITKLAFRNRFTAAEKINIEIAALDNQAAAAQQRQNAALIRVYLKDVDAASFIDLDRQDTKDGVQNLETVGLLATGRAKIILTAEITAEERYRG